MEIIIEFSEKDVRKKRLVEGLTWREIAVDGDQITGRDMCNKSKITDDLEDLFFSVSDKDILLDYFEEHIF